jgi:uncharacterized protein (DUF1778 family)
MKAAVINLRVRPEQRDLIDQAAASLGTSRTDFVLEAACLRAQDVLLERTYFAVNAKAFAAFASLLDQPSVPNPGLTRLLETPSPWSRKTSE